MYFQIQKIYWSNYKDFENDDFFDKIIIYNQYEKEVKKFHRNVIKTKNINDNKNLKILFGYLN